MRPPIRINLVASSLSPVAGGLAASIPPMVAGLARLGGVRIDILATEGPRLTETHAGLRQLHTYGVLGPAAFHWAPGMYRTLKRTSPDVTDVHGLWTFPSLANLRYHRRSGKPYVVTPHGMLDPWALDRSRWKKRIVAAWFENAHLHGATCLRATAEMEAEHFRAFGLRQPIAIVPNGVDIPELPHTYRASAPERRRILFLSRIHPKKGLPFLLRSWAGLAATVPDWELVIAGPDEVGHEEEMRQLAGSLNLPRVRWVGPAHGEAKAALYESADLFVLPTHAENFGLVIAEALAHGVPVITTRNAPWSGLELHQCGWWVELSDQMLRTAMQQAMALTDAERRAMGLRGRAWMEREFGWDRVARDMYEVYQWVVYGGKLPSVVHVS